VLTFTNLSEAGDIFTRQAFPTTGYLEISFDYLGLAKPGSVAGDLGGFFGFSSSLAGKFPTPADSFFAGTKENYGPVSLLDNGEWHRVSHRFRADGMPPLHLVIEDFVESGGVAGDAYFDNITVKAMAGPITVPVIAGPVTNPANGHLYYLLAEDTWQNSEVEAVLLGGHLVTINDKAEQEWVFSTFGSYARTNRSLWIGLREVDVSKNHQWVSGEPITYTRWNRNQPSGGIESFVHMIKVGNGYGHPPGEWNDLPSPLAAPYPEFDPICGVVEVVPSAKPVPPRAASAGRHQNLLANADFELESEPGKPAQWSTFDWADGKLDIKFEWSNESHGGKRSLAISSKEGGDGLWYQTVKLEPYQDYRFSGWVKTQDIVSKGGHGVWFEVGSPGTRPIHFAREPLRGSQDWQRIETVFNSLLWGDLRMVCYFGGAGTITGKVFFDDLSIVRMQEVPRIEGRIVNGSFEEADGDWPLGWSVRCWFDWAPKFEHAKTGRTGSRSVKISAQPHRTGLWTFIAKVKRNTSYRLSGWIRTENLAGARANLDVGADGSFAPENRHFSTEGLQETRDWTPISVTFPAGTNDWVQIACQLSGGDTAAGHAWFDDIKLEENP